jgi:hypothetical protein
MGINFKKIFARKAKEISEQVNEGERLLNDAITKVTKLRSESIASVLREEIWIWVDKKCKANYKAGFSCAMRSVRHDTYMEEQNKITTQLELLLNELCELAERGER